MKRIVAIYRGHVQNVGFRANAVQQSGGLDLSGFVRNQSDGSVQMDVQGPAADVDTLLRRIQSSMSDNIDDVRIDPRDPKERDAGFCIRYA